MGYDANMWACFLYDATYAPALTINWMLDIGMEYEDQPTFRHGFTNTRVTGCTGQISYIQNTNDRDVGSYNINNL